MLSRKVISLAIALQVVLAVPAIACPYCAFSPNGWGFCKYYGYAGAYDCDTVVADPWSGRTTCITCGYCNWSNPNSNRPCDNGFEDCGYLRPCDDHALNLPEPSGACSSSTRVAGSDHLSWIGASVDQIGIF